MQIEKCSRELRREADFLEKQTPLELLESDHGHSAPSRHDNEIERAVYRVQEEANKMVELLKARKKRGYGIDESDLTWLIQYTKIIKSQAEAKKVAEDVLQDMKYALKHNKKMIHAKLSEAEEQELEEAE